MKSKKGIYLQILVSARFPLSRIFSYYQQYHKQGRENGTDLRQGYIVVDIFKGHNHGLERPAANPVSDCARICYIRNLLCMFRYPEVARALHSGKAIIASSSSKVRIVAIQLLKRRHRAGVRGS